MKTIYRLSIVCILLFQVNCSPANYWHRVEGVAHRLPKVSESRLLLGSGLRPSKSGFTSHRCIEDFKTIVSGGSIDIRIDAVGPDYRTPVLGLQDFIDSAREQIEQLARFKAQESSLPGQFKVPETSIYLISVEELNQLLEIDETSVKFSPWVWELIKKGGLSAFFDACGTKLVSSIRLDSSAYAIFGYIWNSASEASSARKLTTDAFDGDSSYSERIRLFDHDLFKRVPLISIYADIGRNSDYGGLPFDMREPRLVIDHFANAIHHSGHGLLKNFRSTFWRDFSVGRYLIANDEAVAGESREPEQVWTKKSQFRAWLDEFWKKYRLIEELEGEESIFQADYVQACRKMIHDAKRYLSTSQWKRCQSVVSAGKSQALVLGASCAPFAALGPILESPACTQLGSLEESLVGEHYRMKLDESLLLSTNKKARYQVPVLNTYGLDSDDSTFVNVPTALKLGTGMNVDGEVVEGSCIMSDDSEQPSISGLVDSYVPGWISRFFEPSGPEAWDQTAWDGLDYRALRASDREQASKIKDKSSKKSGGNGRESGGESSDAADVSGDSLSQFEMPDSSATSKQRQVLSEGASRQTEAAPIDINKVVENQKAGKLSGDLSSAFSDSDGSSGLESILSLKFIESEQGVRKWAWWRPIVFFWRSAPRERPIHRALFEYRGATPLLSPNFQLTAEAEKLAKEDLNEFFNQCGTHYVRRLIHRRGVVVYYTFGSPGDREIAVVPFGLSQQTLANPVFSSRTVREFAKQVEQLRNIMGDPSQAIPERAELEPWINYLRFRGLTSRTRSDVH